jgi:hypothetical protein
MANCKICDKPVGIGLNEHVFCRQAAELRRAPVRVRQPQTAPLATAPPPLSTRGIFWAVFFGVSAALAVFHFAGALFAYLFKMIRA